MSEKIIAGNWKMNKNRNEALDLVSSVLQDLPDTSTKVVFAPPYLYLEEVARMCADFSNVKVAAQNCSHYDKGAYTGEISAQMIASVNADMVIIGHSERREYFGEEELILSEKVNKALKYNLQPIYCVGESLDQRKAEEHFDIIENQIAKALFHLDEESMKKVVIAYEPVWAIGTGETATPEQAQEIHAFIRKLLTDQYGEEIAKSISILYGGSCKPANAEGLFAQPDIDGGLIGGASLVAEDFVKLIEMRS
ncbi:triose-phosphate isomerase [Salibacter halophilus]|uniref:Triosephosphate isomerase n=1 Tax=Salibacter halophilus TaxID=1803916 RepID=A0A6N6M7F6_9FLAO|nr:triose-phosphate isomerase [Salibacter halophilus]KAB1064450.1 triose-phosphate isomerase [Salibacter halophilus]